MNTVRLKVTLAERGQQDEVRGEGRQLHGHKRADQVEVPGIPKGMRTESRRSQENLKYQKRAPYTTNISRSKHTFPGGTNVSKKT